MTIGASLTGIKVSMPTTVSLRPNTTALAVVAVNLIGGLSATGTGTPAPSPPSTSVYSYNFSLPRNSFYITTTAF